MNRKGRSPETQGSLFGEVEQSSGHHGDHLRPKKTKEVVTSVQSASNKKSISRKATYQSIQAKVGEIVYLPLDELKIISEYNTRCSFVEEGHVEDLAQLIQERGFSLTRPLLVNVIRNAAGEITERRVVAGRHRRDGARKAKLALIPCVQYEGLTPQEECLLDRWDNEMDENHKQAHFLAEAEHCRYLVKTKGWSQGRVAQTKGVSRSMVQWKLQIANLPEQVKVTIRGCHHGGTLTERHLREVVRLKNPAHMLLIIKEIIERWRAAEAEEVDEKGVPFQTMKQREILNRVAEFLELESREGVSPQVAAMMPEIEPEQVKGSVKNPHSSIPSVSSSVGPPPEEPSKVPNEEEAELARMREERLAEQQAMGPLGVPSQKRTTEGMKFDLMPRWLRRSPLRKRLGADWDLFDVLVEFSMRYQYGQKSAKASEYFFVEGRGSTPEGSYQYLAELCNVTVVTVKKKLRRLIQKKYLRMMQANLPQYPRFQICWEKLKEEYDASAWFIDYEDGGLCNIPVNVSGKIEPTPFHTIWVRDGVVCQGVDGAVSDVMKELKQLGAKPSFVKKLLRENYLGTLRDLLTRLPSLIESHEQKRGEKVDKPLSFFLEHLKEAPKEGS